jgi:hypothetical protein
VILLPYWTKIKRFSMISLVTKELGMRNFGSANVISHLIRNCNVCMLRIVLEKCKEQHPNSFFFYESILRKVLYDKLGGFAIYYKVDNHPDGVKMIELIHFYIQQSLEKQLENKTKWLKKKGYMEADENPRLVDRADVGNKHVLHHTLKQFLTNRYWKPTEFDAVLTQCDKIFSESELRELKEIKVKK